MTVSVHNPDQYMASLRQIIAQGRKRIGLLVGEGAPAGIFSPGSDKPLIPAVAGRPHRHGDGSAEGRLRQDLGRCTGQPLVRIG